MSTPILTTKLNLPPPKADWVTRPRLLARLDAGLETALTLVCAPAGFGKTTLITSWLHGLGDRGPASRRVAWLSLEPDDDQPLRFALYLTEALQRLDPAVGQTARSLLDGPQPPALKHLLTLLLNDLAALATLAVLVLEDFHVLGHPEVQEATAFFLDHLPPGLHVVVTARDEPNLPLARLRVRRQVTEIRLEDLRFTREEAAAFLAQTMGLELGGDVVDRLESRTEGWVAGLQMAALSLRGREDGLRGLDDFGGAHGDIIDYLGAEVLRQQPAEVRAFLRQTSILDRLSGPLCNAVTGREDGRSLLNHLAQANLFLIPLDGERRWYRYHSLFADLLRTELGEEEERDLHRRASAWYEARGFTPEAVKHALAGRDVAAAERLIRSSIEPTFSHGGFDTLLGWIDALPDETVRRHVDLSVAKAWTLYLRGDMVHAEDYAAAATKAPPGGSPVEGGMLLAFLAFLAINRGDPERAAALGREALALLGETESFFRTTALSHLGQALRLTGKRAAAVQTLRRAVTAGQLLGHHLITLEALGYLTLLLYQQGQLREAMLLCQQAAGQHTDERGNPLPMAGLVLIPLGALCFEVNDLDRAERHLCLGITLCQQMGTIYYTLLGQRTLAQLLHARGEVEEGWQALTAARHLAAQSQSERRLRTIDAVAAELQLRQGQAAAAAATLGALPPRPAERSVVENLAVAHLHLARGEPAAALDLLREVERTARAEGRNGMLVSILVRQALAEKAMRRSSAALELLEEALSLAAPSGYRRAFLSEGEAMAALLAERRAAPCAFVDELRAALSGPAAAEPRLSSSAANQALLEPLGETQLAILRLVADGLSNQEIAERLGITLGTTKWHLNQIYGKLGVASRTQAVAHARRAHLIDTR